MRKWLIWSAGIAAVVIAGLLAAAWHFSGKVEPYVRQQTIAYLERRFKGEVTIGKFDASMPLRDPLKVLLTKGRGAHIHVKASDILLHQHGARAGYPLLKMKTLAFRIEASNLFQSPTLIDEVRLEGMELALPPKGERQLTGPAASGQDADAKAPDVRIGAVVADGARLAILPKDPAKAPLVFDLYKLRLEYAGKDAPMRYTTKLRNAKPPGIVDAAGTFGPFDAGHPGDSPLTGDYVFRGADLSVFKGIAGKLESSGSFQGRLNEIVVDGKTRTPDFRLPAANHPMLLTTAFHAVVDGTNGDTLLQPVNAVLGSSRILCKGGVVRYPGENGKTVNLDCSANEGRLEEFLRLAVKGPQPPMKGQISFNLKIVVPPEKVPYAEKLQLSGPFRLSGAVFTNPSIQEKLDDMSRRAQGRPNDMSITAATSDFEGKMTLKRQLLTIEDLVFSTPGAMVRLAGSYDMKADRVDFEGQVRTEARLSQMMKSGWKRLALKPVDPFFAKNGAGAQFDIEIKGPAGSPQFGLRKKNK